MRIVVQRVTRASVTVDGSEIAAIGRGHVVLVGVEQGDTEREAELLAAKVAKLRVFPDDSKPMNRSVVDVSGEALVVSQFTLAGDVSGGNRHPSLPFCHLSLRGSLPKRDGCPNELRHLGDHLRRKRVDLGLSKAALGRQLGVDGETIATWEAGLRPRRARDMDAIHELLGYCPLDPLRLGSWARAWRSGSRRGTESPNLISHEVWRRREHSRQPQAAGYCVRQHGRYPWQEGKAQRRTLRQQCTG